MKLIKLIIIIVLFMFLLGCGADSGGKKGIQNFKQGYGALEVRFLDNAPPKKIYQGSNFKMIAELDNQAAYDIKNGELKIVGVDQKFFLIMPPLTRNFPLLLGKSLINPSGEKIFIEFDVTAKKELFENAERFQNPYFLKLSFDSIFEFTDTICINPNLYEIYDSGCKVQPKKSYSGQGAPMAITELESIIYPSSAGTEVEFRLLIKNRGQGKANFIQLEKVMLGNEELKDCHFQNSIEDPQAKKVLFYESKQEDILICKTYLSGQASYETTLSLDFSYDYEIKERQQLNLYR